jgi:hypothetical protein
MEVVMTEIHFRVPGDKLRVCINFGFAQVCSYTLRIWDANTNQIHMEKSGNNQNPEDDCYELPELAADNNGRYVHADYSILSPDPTPNDQYYVEVIVFQGNQTVGSMKKSGLMNGESVSSEMWAKLITP